MRVDTSEPRGPQLKTTKPPDRGGQDASGEVPLAMQAPAGTQLCPCCGHPMPDLKGGTGSICGVCGFKDSCCY